MPHWITVTITARKYVVGAISLKITAAVITIKARQSKPEIHPGKIPIVINTHETSPFPNEATTTCKNVIKQAKTNFGSGIAGVAESDR